MPKSISAPEQNSIPKNSSVASSQST